VSNVVDTIVDDQPPQWDVARIAAHAQRMADDTRTTLETYSRLRADEIEQSVAAQAISVAVTNVCWPAGPDGKAYASVLNTVRTLREGRIAGVDAARQQLQHFAYPDMTRSRHAARIRAVADVLDICGVDLVDAGRTVEELRAFANVFQPDAGLSGR
jgi:hypothetical protein